MKYIAFIIFFAFIFSPCAQAADERYRVEVLVLKHLENSEQAQEVKLIEDYSSALDFLTPANEAESMSEEDCGPAGGEIPSMADRGAMDAPPPVAGPDGAPLPEEDGLAAEEIGEEVDPDAVVHVEEMGPEMQEAWRRLRLSGPFRPLQYLAWEQGSEQPFPLLRLHDLDVVLLDDPWSDLRAAEDEFAEAYGDTGYPDPDDNCREPEVDALPEPTVYYALDGTVSLVRTRFLHLNLDLQLREALYEPEPHDDSLQPSGTERQTRLETPQPTAFLVHELEQKRQVRSARMEYFDGPVIGVLAWITSIPLEDAAER